jgi:hypothetical protein
VPVVQKDLGTAVDRGIRTLEALLIDLRRLYDLPAAEPESPKDDVRLPARSEPSTLNEPPTGVPLARTSESASQPLPTRKKRGLNWGLA